MAETRNVPASSMNACPGPIVATIKPPSAGPTRRNAKGLMNWSSELAWSRRCRGTISGTIDVNAGPKNASPVPNTAARTIRCHSSIAPVSEKECRSSRRRPQTMSAAIMIPAPLEPVGDHAADQDEDADRKRPGHADQRERRRRVRELVNLPRERYDVDAVAGEGHGRAGPEQREVPDRARRMPTRLLLARFPLSGGRISIDSQ